MEDSSAASELLWEEQQRADRAQARGEFRERLLKFALLLILIVVTVAVAVTAAS